MSKGATTQINPLVQNDNIWWMCPVCDWLVAGIEIDMKRFDYDCPGCGCRTLSQFVAVAAPKPQENRK